MNDTLSALGSGQLSARASFEDAGNTPDADRVSILTHIIETVAKANDYQAETVEEVTALAEGVADDASEVRDIVEEIATNADEQQEVVTGLADHVGDLDGSTST